MSNIRVDRDAFFRRVKRVYDTWKEPDENKLLNDEMSKVDAIICAVGTDDEMVSWQKYNNTQNSFLDVIHNFIFVN